MASRYDRNKKRRRTINRNKRKKKFSKFLLFILIIILILLAFGKFGEVNIIKVHDYDINSKDLPKAFDNSLIVQFSDMHYGTGFNEKRLGKLVTKINSYKPDVVVFTGDLIDKDYKIADSDIKILTKYLTKIKSKLGKYAVIGEDDYKNDNFKDIMYESEFIVLQNNYDTVYNEDNNPILIYGLDNITYGEPDISYINDKEIESIPYKIVIMHESDYIDEFAGMYDINLVLAGHSHQGQVRLPRVKPLILPKGSKNYYEEHYKVHDSDMYISSGVGSTFFDFRLFSSPSINVFRLYK